MSRKRFIIILLSLLLLLVAHGIALIYRVQPAVSLWFPPSGIAIALTLWFGYLGLMVTGIASVIMAPCWGSDGWTSLVGLIDIIEPLIAWLLYCRCFRGSFSFTTLRDALAFLISAPIVACGTSALVGTLTLVSLGKLSADSLSAHIAHWWVGNATGVLAITPTILLLLTPVVGRWGWVIKNDETSFPAQPFGEEQLKELGIILTTSFCIAGLTVQQSGATSFTLQEYSFLSFIPILWGAIRLGTTGGMLIASFTVLVTLLNYLLLYPTALFLPRFPIETELLQIHKLSLLVQCAVGLLVGTAITERETIQTTLAIEKLRRAEYQSRAQLSEQLFQLNRLLTETNQQLQESEELFRASIDNMLDCFSVCSAIRNQAGQIIDFRIDYINDAACINNQMTKEEQLGCLLCEMLPGHRESGLFEEYSQVVETGQSLIKDALVYEDNYGQSRLTRAFDIRAAKFGDGIVVTWRDVTAHRQSEEELKQRQQEFEALVENSPDTICRFDPQLRYVYVNRAIEKATGISVSDFIGKTVAELEIAQDYYQQWQDKLQQVLQTAQEQTDEFSFPSPDGTLHFYQSRLVPELAEDGSVNSVLVVTRDLTNLKQIEKQLQEQQHFIGRITDTVPGILYVYDLLEERNIYANRQIAESLGYTPEEIQQMRENFFPQLMHPEDLERLNAQLPKIQALEDGQIIEFEFRMRHANGQWRWFSDRATVFARTPQGLAHQMLGVAQDISERKEIEIALMKANERFNLATTAVNSMIYDWDVQNNQIERTAALTRLLGYLPEEAEPTCQWWWEQIHPEDQQWLPTSLEAAPTIDNCYSSEYRVRNKQGQYIYVQDQGIILRNSSGEVVRVVGSTTDISARKQVEEALRHSEARLRRIVDSNIIGIFFGYLDGQITEANQAFLQIVGYSRQELLAGEIRWDAITPPEHLEPTRQAQEELKNRGICTPFEKEFFRQDGSRVWVEIGGALFEQAQEGVCYVIDISDRKQVQEALRLSEERYRLLSETVPTILFTNLPDGWSDYTSQQFYDYTGMPLGSADGFGWVKALHPEDQDRSITLWNKCIKEGSLFQIEYRLRRADGQYRWFLGRSSPIYDSQGQLIKWFGVCHDIDDLKTTQAALQRSEARARRLVDSNLIGVLFADFEGNILDANDAFLNMIGYSREELSQVNWREMTPIEYAYLDEQAIAQVRETGTCTPFEKEYLRKDGTRVPILLGTAQLLESKTECVCFVLDLTERKRAEAQKQQLVSLVENSTDFIGVATLEGKPIFLNRAGQQLVGLNEETFRQTAHILEYFAAEDQNYVKNTILPTLKRQGFWQGEYRFRHFITGKLIPVFYNIFTIREPKTGKPLTYATVTREISQQKRIEAQRAELLIREQAARQQAETANRMKDEFLAIVSHELRSPLNAILGWSRLLRTGKMDQTTTERALEIIERNAQAQTQLIEDLLDISRIIRGKIRLYLRPLQLSQVVQAAIDTVNPTASTKQIQLRSNLDPCLIVSGDFDRLQQVVWNLLSNGIKFTPQGGQVTIRLSQVEHLEQGLNRTFAQIQVMDTGKGISSDFLPYVFERFRQGDGTTSRTQGGLGLGLAIVRNLVELHGGTVSAASLGEGQGATFTVELPLLPPIEFSGNEEQPSPLLTSDTSIIQGLKILVVDDELYSREFLLTALSHYGASVRAAASSQEALQLLLEDKPDVLLSDIGMPEEDGYTLIRRVRSLPPEQGGQIPAAALTAYVREEDRIEAIAAGFQMHVPKPIDPMQLLNVIARLVGRI